MWPNLESALKFKLRQPYVGNPIFNEETDEIVVYLDLSTDLPFNAFGAERTTDENSTFHILKRVAGNIAERIEGACEIAHCMQRPAPPTPENPDGVERYDEIYVRLELPYEWTDDDCAVPDPAFTLEVKRIAAEERMIAASMLDSVPLIRTLQAEFANQVSEGGHKKIGPQN